MKKRTLIAGVHALLCSAGALAQGSATLYGQLDTGLESLSHQAGGSRTFFAGAGASAPTLFGFRGSEDLGGGLSAIFLLEGSMNVGSGATNTGVNSNGGFFGRAAYVGAKADVGTFKFGLQLDPAFISYLETDPRGMAQSFSGLQAWINSIAPQATPSTTTVNIFDQNAVSYSFSAGAFNGTALYSFGNAANSAGSNSLWSLGGSYKQDALQISAGAFKDKPASATGTGAASEWNLGLGYKISALTLKANYLTVQPNVPGNSQFGTWGLGGEYAASGLLTLNAAFYNSKDKTQGGSVKSFTFGADYALSKRTALYGQWVSARQSASGWSGGAIVDQNGGLLSAGQTVSGLAIGIRHSF